MIPTATARIAQLLSDLRRETEASQIAILSSAVAHLELHTRNLEQISEQLRIEFSAPLSPELLVPLIEARRSLAVYRAVLRRAAKYARIQSNVLALCAKECSYGPNAWVVAALQSGR